jgi:uncharacterized protein (DUF433 family)
LALISHRPLLPVYNSIVGVSSCSGGGICNMDFADLVARDPGVCGGEAVFSGTRVPLRTVLASLADGDSEETILSSFPTLTREQVRAAISFAARSAVDDLPYAGTPNV